MGKLVREERREAPWFFSCRQCDSFVGRDRPAVYDAEEPWLAFHEDCLHEVVLERIVNLYDAMVGPGRKDPFARVRAKEELARLRREIDNVELLIDSRSKELLGHLRPGIRREPV